MKLYEEIKFSGYDWYVIEEKECGYVLLMKNCLMDKPYLDEENQIEFDESTRMWCDSNIRKVLNEEFIKELQEDILLRMNTRIRYDEKDVFTTDKVRLLTIHELIELPYRIQNSNLSYWTMSPNGSGNGLATFLWGYGDSGAGFPIRAIRPVVFINKDKMLKIEEEKKIPEKINYEAHIGIDLSEIVCKKLNEIIDYLENEGDE